MQVVWGLTKSDHSTFIGINKIHIFLEQDGVRMKREEKFQVLRDMYYMVAFNSHSITNVMYYPRGRIQSIGFVQREMVKTS